MWIRKEGGSPGKRVNGETVSGVRIPLFPLYIWDVYLILSDILLIYLMTNGLRLFVGLVKVCILNANAFVSAVFEANLCMLMYMFLCMFC